ncbi:MAG: hypothetical protein ACR2QC_01715 [Gammaproteobacteria bacterium]
MRIRCGFFVRICGTARIFPLRRRNSAVRRRIPPLPPSHSCEGRNLRRRKAAGNCTFVRLRRQFAPSAMRFLPSQEWD